MERGGHLAAMEQANLLIIDSSGFAHVRITVTDIARSKAFYDQVFGWPIAVDASGSAGERSRVGLPRWPD